MDFEQIILNEIENIDGNYSNTYTETHCVYRYAEEEMLTGLSGISELPYDLRLALSFYFGTYYDTNGEAHKHEFLDCAVSYVRNYYYEANWTIVPPEFNLLPNLDSTPPPSPGDPAIYSTIYIDAAAASNGYWEYGPHIFCGGTYSGTVSFDPITVNVTASGPTIDAQNRTEVDSMSLRAMVNKGVYVIKQKVNGVWDEPIVGRDPSRTGGLWTDTATYVDYEYEPNVPAVPHPVSTGSIHSTGEYIYVDSIPTGTSWHGPTFVHTLPSYFRIVDLGSFSANLSLVHGGDGLRQSRTCVSLYDENLQIALSLMIADDFSTKSVYFQTTYYPASDPARSISSELFTGDTTGVVTIRYDPRTALWGKTPGHTEQFLLLWNELDQYRLIKYVAVQSFRNGAVVEHDERVYNVRLSYAGSEYTVFHDNANDMYEFHRDPLYSNGVLDVPSGASYMTWTSIDTGSGWHGPRYSHVLDRPFRLYQLNEFSVFAELIQGAGSAMGITSVALLDEYGARIMAIEWGDDLSSWTEGWFRAVFYPQTGGQYSRYLWYGEESFAVTISMWWDPATGQGSIYTKRGDLPYEYLVRAVYNASRVVKSVLIEGLRYGSNPLLDMRIHDLAVMADPNLRVPSIPEPMEADGTNEGTINTDNPPPEAQSIWDSLLNIVGSVISWWVGWWPRVHLYLSFATLAGGIAVLHMSVDLLFDLRFENSTIDTPLDDEMTEAQMNEWSAQIKAAINANGPSEDFFIVTATIMIYALLILCALLLAPLPPGADSVKYMAMLYYTGIFSSWLMTMIIAVSLGIISEDYMAGLASIWMSRVIEGLFVTAGVGAVILVAYYAGKEWAKSAMDWLSNVKFIWGIISILFYFVINAMMLIVWIIYLEASLANYLGVSI